MYLNECQVMNTIIKIILIQKIIESFVYDFVYIYRFLCLQELERDVGTILYGGANISPLIPAPSPPSSFKRNSYDKLTIHGNHSLQMRCEDIQIKNSNIYLHYHNKSYLKFGCTNNETELILDLYSRVHIDYISKLFSSYAVKFVLSGLRDSSLVNDLFYEQILLLPSGSIIIDITYTNYIVHPDIPDEIFRNSFTYYNKNFYIKFVNYIVTIPKEIKFTLNNKNKVINFSCDPHKLENFNDTTIVNWQVEKIREFITLFYKFKNNLEEHSEFKEFIETYLYNDSASQNYINSFKYLNRYKELLLFNCVFKEETVNIKQLIQDGVDINTKTLIRQDSIIYIAATKNYTSEFIKYLIGQGADVHALNKHNLSALVPAIINSNLDIINTLLAAGINIDIKEKISGNTAMHFAVTENNDRIIKLLLQYQPDISLVNNMGYTVLKIAEEQNNQQTAELLYKYKNYEICIAEQQLVSWDSNFTE